MRFTAKKGFTLIELLIVVVIIGILAAIAIPKFASTKEKAYIASMKSDLRNLATSEEAYFSDKNVYTITQTDMNFTPSTGNVITITSTNTGTGWHAVATNTRVTSVASCQIGIGTDTTTAADGVVTCP
ncbi:MAG TPA: prepilin-type N-terminal cleavage/methylation domain-containing protein [Gemmatimonadaceae bacterium]